MEEYNVSNIVRGFHDNYTNDLGVLQWKNTWSSDSLGSEIYAVQGTSDSVYLGIRRVEYSPDNFGNCFNIA